MPKVAFNEENVKRCRCPVCPVQRGSQCVAKLMESMPKNRLPTPEEMPGVYCSSGKALCKDLDPSQPCLCPTCGVWNNYNLHSTYYCQNGSADEVG